MLSAAVSLAALAELQAKIAEQLAAIQAQVAAFSPYQVGEWKNWALTSPPAGWLVRRGGLITNASTAYPKLYQFLQAHPELYTNEGTWQSYSQSYPWYGVGGVPLYVLNTFANTIRLPDTRGMFEEDAGFDGLGPLGWHSDTIVNITGMLRAIAQRSGASPSGAFYNVSGNYVNNYSLASGSSSQFEDGFDASRVVRTGNKVAPRAYGVLGCIYAG